MVHIIKEKENNASITRPAYNALLDSIVSATQDSHQDAYAYDRKGGDASD